MKQKIIQITTITILVIITNSCIVRETVNKSRSDTINILSVDSLKFINYYNCEFKSKSNISGYLLIEKSKTDLTSSNILISEKFRFNDLCDVIEFQSNNSDITYRGNSVKNRIYENDELLIDLSNDIDKRYYELCFVN